MVFQQVFDYFFNQVTGFALWLLVTPFRLVAVLLDPIFGSFWDFLDPAPFLAQIEVLRGFFTDVNWFLPFAACVGMVRLVLDSMLLYTCAKAVGASTLGEVRDLAAHIVHFMVSKVGNGVEKFLDAVLHFFFPVASGRWFS